MKYQFCIRFSNIDANSAASKAVLDCNAIFSSNGYIDYTFTVGDNSQKAQYYRILFKELFAFFFSVKKSSLVAIQYPLLSINSVFKHFIKIAKLKKVKFYCIVHDLESLRTGGKDTALIKAEVDNLNCYDALIVHNDQMLGWLKAAGVTTPMIPLYLFDYLSENVETGHHDHYNSPIVYAGNLGKSTFIYSLGKLKEIEFRVYGPNFQHQNNEDNPNLSWMGEYSPQEITHQLKGSFGLIWDGSLIDACDEVLGNYLKFNNPHKCSLYIAAGLPLIAPKSSAIGKFILQHQIGIVIDSLYELNALKPDIRQYEMMRYNVMQIRQRVIAGDYFNEAIQQIEKDFVKQI